MISGRTSTCCARRRFVAEAGFLRLAIDQYAEDVSRVLDDPGEALAWALLRALDGEGEDATGVAPTRGLEFRGQAFAMLEPFVRELEELDEPTEAERPLIHRALRTLLGTRRLAQVREAAALERLDEAERTAWEAFWQRTRAVYKRLVN